VSAVPYTFSQLENIANQIDMPSLLEAKVHSFESLIRNKRIQFNQHGGTLVTQNIAKLVPTLTKLKLVKNLFKQLC
jgi:hypothetical protein